MQLNVMSFNIKHLAAGSNAVLKLLSEQRPDVVAIQEPPRALVGQIKMRTLARKADMVAVATGGWPRSSPSTALFVATRLMPQVQKVVRKTLPWRPVQLWPRFPSRRGYCAVDLGEWVIFSVHLGLDPQERTLHRNIIMNAAQVFGPARAVIAGDLNEKPDGPSWSAFTRRLRDAALVGQSGRHVAPAATFPAHKPRLRIDAILVGLDVSVLQYQVLDTDLTRIASDHLPVAATLGTTAAKYGRK